MARFLTLLDAPMWRVVRKLYYEDKVVEAFHEAENLGGQDSNDLFAEAEAREKGEQMQVLPWLRVEFIRDELGESVSGTLTVIEEECVDLCRRFGWDYRERTLVTFMPVAVEGPWMPGRWGYFIDKVPYDKICLPNGAAFNKAELTRVIRHEFMHQITANLANGHQTWWLSEALSSYAEGALSQRWRGAASQWLNADMINAAISSDARDDTRINGINAAYAQAGAIGRFLAHHGGDARLGELLRAVGDESVRHGLGEKFLGRSRTDSALRDIYGLSERQVFDCARDWVKAAPPA
ncbi:MAG: hypothetical protein ACHQ50_14380 [Fimbriimonadales bacterium]